MAHLLLVIIYISFISLGLPDSLLGSAWPAMHESLSVPLSYAGYVSMVISLGTIVSSFFSARLTRRFGTGRITAVSVAMTAVAMLGFSLSESYILLLLWAIPYGFGAGSIDAALNNYVALNYAPRHMSWLHCMWGVGTVVGPYVMGYALTRGISWSFGYRTISVIQAVLTVLLIVSLPLWKKGSGSMSADEESGAPGENKSIRELFAIGGVPQVLITFFCYCALEIIAIVWSGTYLAFDRGFSAESAASVSSMFFIGITVGRAVGGFLTYKLNDRQMIRLGEGVIALGCLILLATEGKIPALVGLFCIGVGCAPVYPSVIHSTPEYFGRENSDALIGLQLTFAYTGMCIMPPVFGWVAERISPSVFPIVLAAILIVIACMHEWMIACTKRSKSAGISA